MASTQKMKYVVQYVARLRCLQRTTRLHHSRVTGWYKIVVAVQSPVKPIAEDKIGQDHFYLFSLSQY